MRYILVRYLDYPLSHIPQQDWNNIVSQIGGSTSHKVLYPQPLFALLIDSQLTIKKIGDKYVRFIVDTHNRNHCLYPAGLSNILFIFDNFQSLWSQSTSTQLSANDARRSSIINEAVGKTVHSLSHVYQVLGICLASRNVPPLTDLSNPQWWVQKERYLQPVLDLEEQLKWVNYYVDTLDNFLEKQEIAEVIEQHLVSQIEVQHRDLPNTAIQPWHLGITDEASTGFVEDCIRSLVPQGITFTIWADAVVVPLGLSSKKDYNWDKMTGEPGMYYDEIFFKNPHLYNSFKGEIITTFHSYIDYQGKVYDSQFAYPHGIDLPEYHTKITSN